MALFFGITEAARRVLSALRTVVRELGRLQAASRERERGGGDEQLGGNAALADTDSSVGHFRPAAQDSALLGRIN